MVKVTCHHYKCMEMLCLGLFSLKNGIKYLSMSLFCFRLVTCSLLQRSCGGFFPPHLLEWFVSSAFGSNFQLSGQGSTLFAPVQSCSTYSSGYSLIHFTVNSSVDQILLQSFTDFFTGSSHHSASGYSLYNVLPCGKL